VLVPDLAGWRRERMPRLPRDHRFEVAPDWVCEILSPSTAKTDLVTKMPVYNGRYGVPYLWLVDPLVHTLEAFALRDGRWMVIGLFQERDSVTVEPPTSPSNWVGCGRRWKSRSLPAPRRRGLVGGNSRLDGRGAEDGEDFRQGMQR
jgi:hypothetical protein